MIEGRILMTQVRMDQLVVDMLTMEHEAAMYYLKDELDRHCDNWQFGQKDRQLLQTELSSRYWEAYKFFDKPDQSGT